MGARSGDEFIAAFIGRSTARWRKVIFCFSPMRGFRLVRFDTPSGMAFFKHVATLKVDYLEEESSFKSQDIQYLLWSAPYLKELRLLSPSRQGFNNGTAWLDVNDAVGPDWVCDSLEDSACQVRNIPRTDVTRRTMSEPASNYTLKGTMEESRRIQERLYTKLDRLIGLRELTFNVPLSQCITYTHDTPGSSTNNITALRWLLTVDLI